MRQKKVVATDGDIDWMITYHPVTPCTQDVQDENALRWQIEQFQRELKQLTGSEKCQCRKARSQRNHLGYCYLARLALRLRAQDLDLTIYQVRERIFDDFLTEVLRHPLIPVTLPV